MPFQPNKSAARDITDWAIALMGQRGAIAKILLLPIVQLVLIYYAQRLSEMTRLEAKTLHRLLEFDPRTMAFK